MNRILSCLFAVALLLAPAAVHAQGLLVVVDPDSPVRLPRPIIIYPPHPIPLPHPQPEPPGSYKIKELDVQTRLVDQVAQVQVSQTFENTGGRQLEVAFVFPLPYDGAIDQMTLLVDGKEYPAKLLSAEEARKLYEEIVRKNRDPALLEWMGTGMFRTSVFPVPAGAKRTVSLRYSQLCRKQEGLTDFLFPLSTAKYTSQPVENIRFRVTIESAKELKNVYSPTHPVDIKRPDDRHATITYSTKNEVPASDFRLLFDIGSGELGANVLSYRPRAGEDGFFLLLASPKIQSAHERPPEKTVVFVMDRSGSMSGEKIEQARGALKFVLNNLHQGDLFNIVAYDSQIEVFRPELQRYDDQTRKAALGFVEGIYSGGSTDIDGALRAALTLLQDSSRPTYVIFLTDGLPTAGETNEMKIVDNAKKENTVRARLFAFGVGYDVNSRLLDRLVRDNFGQSEYVRPHENIEERVSGLYRRIGSPVMTDVAIEFTLDSLRAEAAQPINRVYPKGAFDLFAGEQLVVVGRYKAPGEAKVVVRGAVGGKEQTFNFPAKLVAKSPDESQAFVEKLWAVRRVGEILDELDLKGKNDELVKELVELATRHGILTPYTSFLADERTNVRDLTSNTQRAGERLIALDSAGGQGGFVQRAMKGVLQRTDQPMPAEASMGVGGGTADLGSLSYGAQAGEEMKQAVQTVRNVGNRVFYRREGQWVDSSLSKEQEGRAIRVRQFSAAYFKLASAHGRTLSQYMVFDEPVLVDVAGQAYLIEP